MLQTSRMSVADVAYSLGFENPTHFSRIFKQQYGVPPVAYTKLTSKSSPIE